MTAPFAAASYRHGPPSIGGSLLLPLCGPLRPPLLRSRRLRLCGESPGGSVSLHEIALLERGPPAVPDDDVVEDFDAEDLAGVRQPLRGGDVFRGGVRVAGGVVVDED